MNQAIRNRARVQGGVLTGGFTLALTALLLGYKTAERLYELERISGSESAIERLDDVLFHKIPYISDYI